MGSSPTRIRIAAVWATALPPKTASGSPSPRAAIHPLLPKRNEVSNAIDRMPPSPPLFERIDHRPAVPDDLDPAQAARASQSRRDPYHPAVRRQADCISRSGVIGGKLDDRPASDKRSAIPHRTVPGLRTCFIPGLRIHSHPAEKRLPRFAPRVVWQICARCRWKEEPAVQ